MAAEDTHLVRGGGRWRPALAVANAIYALVLSMLAPFGWMFSPWLGLAFLLPALVCVGIVALAMKLDESNELAGCVITLSLVWTWVMLLAIPAMGALLLASASFGAGMNA